MNRNTQGGRPGATVLVVDDDQKLADLVSEYLVKEGFAVDVVGDGDSAVERILSGAPDVVVLDVMLPGCDGFDVCRRVRDQYRGMILMLTARGGEIDEVLGLEIGADDYMAKPVRPRLLVSRIKALLRRREPPPGGGEPEVLEVGDLRIDVPNRRVECGGGEIDLTTGEFDLLLFLALRKGETVTRDEIYRGLRGVEYDGLDRTVDLGVARLRKKLEDDRKNPRRIKSVRGVGYLLVPEGTSP